MAVNILGISAFFHDSAAALTRNGEIIAADQEEHSTRRKHESRFPGNAIVYCLAEGGIDVTKLDYVAFYTQKEMDLASSIQHVCEEMVLRQGPFKHIWIRPAAGNAGGALGSALLIWHHLLGKPRQPGPQDSQQGSLLGHTV